MHTLFTHLYNAFIVSYYSIVFYCDFQLYVDRRARDRVIVGFTTTYVISDLSGRWFSSGTPIFFTNKSNRHDIAEILLKVMLNSITLILTIALQLYTLLEKLLPSKWQSCF